MHDGSDGPEFIHNTCASDAPGAPSGQTHVPAPPQPTPESHITRVLRPRVLGVPVLTLACLAFATFAVLTNYLPTRIETVATEKQIAEQQAHNAQLASNIRVAEETKRLVETDRWTNERILRDELHMTRKGEAVLR